jgi:hypothetical protein
VKNTEGSASNILTERNYILIKKEKNNTSENTVLPPTAPLKPQHKHPTGGGYAAAQTFCDIKKRHPFVSLTRGSKKRKVVPINTIGSKFNNLPMDLR